MAAQRSSAWRVDDATAYALLRDAARTLVAILLEMSRTGRSATADNALNEVAAIRHLALQVDGYDRAAVDSLRGQFEARAVELARGAS